VKKPGAIHKIRLSIEPYPDKAKPFAKRGRKATDLSIKKMAGLPKDKSLVCPAFLFMGA